MLTSSSPAAGVQVEGGEFFVLRRVERIERVADRLGLTSELEGAH
jgi:hypothetical protein